MELVSYCLVFLSDYHCKENDGTNWLQDRTRTPWTRRQCTVVLFNCLVEDICAPGTHFTRLRLLIDDLYSRNFDDVIKLENMKSDFGKTAKKDESQMKTQ